MEYFNIKKPKDLLNLHTLKVTLDKDIYTELIKTVKLLSIKRFSKVIGPLLNNKRVQKVLPCFSSSLESMSEAKYFLLPSLDRILEFYKLIILSQSSKINDFVLIRERFEELLINNEITLCENLLLEFRDKHGESIWWIKSKLILLFYNKNTDEMQSFCDELKLRSGKGIFTYYTNSLILSTQASFPVANLEKIILKAIEEFDKAGKSHVSWFLDILFFPKILSVRDVELHDIYALMQLPVIDMYSMLTSSLYSYVSFSNASPEKKKTCYKFLNDVSKNIDDAQVESSTRYLKGQSNHLVGLERDLVVDYENGKYAKVLNTFIEFVRKINHPVNYLNIIAKSCIRQKVQIKTGLPLIDDTVRNLIDIHSLSSRASQARQEIIERIVRLNGTNISLQLQALLIVAIPQFFKEKTLKNVLEIFICRHDHSLPIVKSIIASGKKIFSDNYSFFEPDNVTNERTHRCHHNKNNFFDKKLEEITESDFLIKDFIEYKSRVFVSTNSISELVDLAADCLVQYPESYVCFPIDNLVEHIEQDFIHDMNAIIVCYYFVKFVSSDKRTLLNEIFEEYFISSGKSKLVRYLKILQSRIKI